ncbi:MAG: hypothetical protein MJZ37_04180 [Bacilli bacterium]|nr:hypothetical protein [Bacilli bacterium]
MKLTKYEKLHQRYITRMSSLRDTDQIDEIWQDIVEGRTHILKMKRLESSSFDLSWIKEIEDCIFDLGTIVKSPKITTKTVGDVVQVELARKIGAESVQHLASHTNYVKEIDEQGNVIPSKILNIGSEDQYATYENKFIATLIRRLLLFIEKRYEYASKFVRMNNADVLYIKNKSLVDGMEVEIETKVKITQPIEADIEQAKNYLNRILEIRKHVMFYYNSDFMKKLKTERNVRNPIIMTNIIKKNPYYNHCYRLYKFIESYDSIGMTHKVNETYSDVTKKDIEDINTTLLANFLSISSEQPSASTIRFVDKEAKPKVLNNLDDEIFEFGPLNKGPISFVRIDEEYLFNMNARHRVPPHLDAYEKAYYEDEIMENIERNADLEELKKLIRRKKEEYKLWEQRVETNIERRQWEEEMARRKEELRQLKEREALLKKAREQLINSALNDEEVVAEREARKAEKEAKLKAEQEALEAENAGKKRSKRDEVAARERAIEKYKQIKLAKKLAKKEKAARKIQEAKDLLKAKKAKKKEKLLAKEAELKAIAKQKKKEKKAKRAEKEKELLKEKKAQLKARAAARKAKAKAKGKKTAKKSAKSVEETAE